MFNEVCALRAMRTARKANKRGGEKVVEVSEGRTERAGGEGLEGRLEPEEPERGAGRSVLFWQGRSLWGVVGGAKSKGLCEEQRCSNVRRRKCTLFCVMCTTCILLLLSSFLR
jgi:hypothetical protein